MHLIIVAFPKSDNSTFQNESLIYCKEFSGCNENAKYRPIRLAWPSSL